MAASRRCTMCALSLPDTQKWAKCPSCLEPTDRIDKEPNTTDEEATSILRDTEFQAFLEKEGRV